MCGIAGHVGPAPPPPERIEQALELLRHRGPDHRAHRTFTTTDDRYVTLLHARLSIIDLDPRSNQPFHRGSQWLAYNGELYNYLELREQLRNDGAEFDTDSDTEVLAQVLNRDGWGGLDRCEGMWAFASYDEASGATVLSRDRFGEKPLYVHRDADGGLWFASEPKALFALLGRRLEPNLDQIRRFLVNGYKSLYKSGETFFAGLEELEPGTVLEVDSAGDERRRRYWSPPDPLESEMEFEDAVAGTRDRLIRSVELRLRADVPLAFCMSGGVDSVSLISIARRVLGEEVHGFTIVNQDARYDEQEMVAAAVAELGVRHTEVRLDTTDFLARLRGLVRQHDSPVATISYFVQWLLMGAIHGHGFRVSVSGTAADELFSGYYDHHLAYLREVREDPKVFAAARAAWTEHVRPLVRNPFLRDSELFVRDPGFRDHIYLDAPQFASWLTNGAAAADPEPFGERRYTGDLLRNRMLNELFAEAVPVILHEDDLNAMSFSIENRSPFLDRDLFDFSLTIPTRHLVRDGRAKAVLREAMRGIAPDAVLENRRKVGFNAPIGALLDTEDAEVRDQLLADSPIWEVVRREQVEALLDGDELPNSRSKFLFSVLASKMFLEECGCA